MSSELTPLLTLAVEIDALNEQANIYANQALIYAAKCGQKLLLAKAQCNHGQFKSWLDENCRTSYTNAKNYMQLATKMPELLKGQTSDLLKLSQAIALLNAPDEVKTEVTTKIEAGEDVTVKEIQRLKKEAIDAQQKAESLQNDLIGTQQKLDGVEFQLRSKESTLNAIKKQNDDLREELHTGVSKKVAEKLAEERAALVLENSNAIQQAEHKASEAQDALEKMKKDYAKEVKDGVNSELSKRKTEIDQLEYSVESLRKQKEALETARNLLDKENGIIKQHQDSIGTIGEAIQDIKSALYLAEESGHIPVELINEWGALNFALAELAKQSSVFCNRGSNSIVIEGDFFPAENKLFTGAYA